MTCVTVGGVFSYCGLWENSFSAAEEFWAEKDNWENFGNKTDFQCYIQLFNISIITPIEVCGVSGEVDSPQYYELSQTSVI